MNRIAATFIFIFTFSLLANTPENFNDEVIGKLDSIRLEKGKPGKIGPVTRGEVTVCGNAEVLMNFEIFNAPEMGKFSFAVTLDEDTIFALQDIIDSNSSAKVCGTGMYKETNGIIKSVEVHLNAIKVQKPIEKSTSQFMMGRKCKNISSKKLSFHFKENQRVTFFSEVGEQGADYVEANHKLTISFLDGSTKKYRIHENGRYIQRYNQGALVEEHVCF